MAQQTYLALGDSYSIGEGLKIEKSWPFQLVESLNSKGFNFDSPKIIAKTGWRTDELIQTIDEQLDDEKQFDLVSLLIGVNNQYQEKSLDQYKREFKELLETAILKSKHKNKGVFVVSIPDYGVTPFAKEKDKTNAIEDLKRYNKFAQKQCQKYGVAFYDITELSAELSQNDDMLIEDRLHPNAKQYGAWVDSFLGDVIRKIDKK
ncbi:MAG: SGNH/GDSL hydrolase family protein [Bacteroidetes bacterium]|jgi:lysophospholipase L1-like esterase|nr:SGNH/GDSL hydrolase family protein [Bacteroidota bacterium]